MKEFYLQNKDLQNLINSKIKKYQPSVFDRVKSFIVEKIRKEENLIEFAKSQNNEELGLWTRIRRCYKVDLDKLCYMVTNKLAECTPFSPLQPNNKWKNEVINLPIKINEMTEVPFECIYYGGTYKKPECKDLKDAFEQNLKWIDRDQLFVVKQKKGPRMSTVDLFPKNEENVRKNRVENQVEYPRLRYKRQDQNTQNRIIYNVMDNLVAQNLIDSGILSEREVIDALKKDKLEIPTKEVAKTREIHYVLKDVSTNQSSIKSNEGR